MAKKTSTLTEPQKAPAPKPAAKASTTVRNSAIPKVPTSPVTPIAREVTHEMVAHRAYEISISGTGGSEFDNWIRAERELKGL